MLKVNVRVKGPLFDPGAPAAVNEALNAIVSDTVAEGERLVKLDLRPGHGLLTGHYARSVHGEVTGSLHGIVHDSRVVYGPWLEGVSNRNRTTRFKGYAMFRRAAQQLQRNIGRIAQTAIDRLTRSLGGKG